ncbi:ATP-binding protein [Vreelandella titanicae]|uniref:ATP-binding protein n=1 Tax=Vreelandella titanicae TaxID=664683 RepID=A0A558JBB8_9GAMM|nr:ATP-binding protein [Halomonas titanicae]TVU90945.1 ATP-binding protein [Halomonas titanicae]
MTKVIVPTDASKYSFPIVTNHVLRDGTINTLEMYLKNNNIIYIYGDEGFGKTALAGKLVERNIKNCIAISIDPAVKYSYNEDSILKDVYLQIKTYLGEPSNADVDVEKKDFNKLISTVEYFLKKNDKRLLFVLDGFDQVVDDDVNYVKEILDALPIGVPFFDFVFTAKKGFVEKSLNFQQKKIVNIDLFSLDEACQILRNVERDKVSLLISAFSATPETLLTINRILEQGGCVDDILQMNVDDTEGLFEEEWKRSIALIDQYSLIICALAYSKSSTTISQLSNEFSLSSGDVENLKKITFLVLEDSFFSFSSLGFLKFAKTKLADYKVEAIRRVINIAGQSDRDNERLASVAEYYQEIGDSESVLAQLTNENLELMLEESRSINELLRQISIGIKSAEKNEPELLRLCYFKALLSGIKASGLLKSELKSLLKKEDVKSALDLTNNASSNEEKLQMLCILAADYKSKGKPQPDHVNHQINSLYESINPDFLGIDKTLDIAMDLLSFDSEKAMSLINKIDSLDNAGENKSEYALFKFTIQALQRNPDAFDANVIDVKNISEKKRNAIEAIRVFKKGKPAAKIIDGLKNIEKPGEKIFILRHWIKSFPESHDNNLLVNHVLDLAIKTTEYSANASFYSDVLACFPYLLEDPETNKIYRKVLFQLPNIKKLGPTVNYVEILLILSEYENKIGVFEYTQESILQYILNEIDDKSVALAAISLMSTRIANDSACMAEVIKAKEELFDIVVTGTAEHCEVLKEAFSYEVEFDFLNALSWSKKLNTEFRRSEASSQVISQYLNYKQGVGSFNIDFICSEIRRISINHFRDDCVNELLSVLIKGNKISNSEFKNIKKLALRTKNIAKRCNFSARLIDLMHALGLESVEQKKSLESKLSESWDRLDSDYKKIDHAFKISACLSDRDTGMSDQYINKAISLRQEATIDNENVLNAFVSSIDLQIRAFYFLVKNKAHDQQDLELLVETISTVPSVSIKARQFSRLASVLQKSERAADSKMVIRKFITPLLESLGAEYTTLYAVCAYHTSPIIFLDNQVSLDRVLERIKHGDVYMYDSILGACIDYIRTDCILGDPFTPVKNYDYSLDYTDVECIFSLISKMCNDYSIYYQLSKLAKDVRNSKKRRVFTSAQYDNIKGNYLLLEESFILHQRGVPHYGYKLCVQAVRLSLEDNKQASDWYNVIDSARLIPNQSDKAYVLGAIAELAPASLAGEHNFQKNVFDEAFNAIESIPSFYDKLGRYEGLASKSKEFNKNFAKKCLKKAFLISAAEDTEDRINSRLSLIDAAYGIDEDFPDTLSAVYNDDPARKTLLEKNIARKKKEETERKKFNLESSDISSHSHSDKYADLAWQLLGKLNASNHAPIKSNKFYTYLKGVGDYDHEKMYPLLSYYLHLLGEKHTGRKNAQKYMRPIFDIVRYNTISFSKIYKFESVRKNNSISNSTLKSVVVNVGEYDKGLSFVAEWVSKLKNYEILIFDPYFEIGDLSFIGKAINKDPDFKLKIFTTIAQKSKWLTNGSEDIADAVSEFWKDNISTDAMPEIEILYAGAESLNWGLPIHDRWWLAEDSGVSIGTSLNGLGKSLSLISILEANETAEIEQRLEGFLSKKQRVFNDKKVRYESVTV